MPRVEKVCCLTIRHEDAEDARKAPVIPLRHLHLEYVGGYPSQQIEHSKCHRKAPCGGVSNPSVKRIQSASVQKPRAKDQKYISILDIIKEKLI